MDKHGEKDINHDMRLRSSVVTLTVRADERGRARIVLEGVYMPITGFKDGDIVEAIIQPELISILRAE